MHTYDTRSHLYITVLNTSQKLAEKETCSRFTTCLCITVFDNSAFVDIYIYIYIYIIQHILQVTMYVCMYTCVCVCSCMYVCIYIYIYIYIYTHTHTHTHTYCDLQRVSYLNGYYDQVVNNTTVWQWIKKKFLSTTKTSFRLEQIGECANEMKH